jgi:hypothetical protein
MCPVDYPGCPVHDASFSVTILTIGSVGITLELTASEPLPGADIKSMNSHA